MFILNKNLKSFRSPLLTTFLNHLALKKQLSFNHEELVVIITGHKKINSLYNYIDIAKSELTNMNKVVDNLLEVRDIESIDKENQRLLIMLKNKKITTTDYIKQIEKL